MRDFAAIDFETANNEHGLNRQERKNGLIKKYKSPDLCLGFAYLFCIFAASNI